MTDENDPLDRMATLFEGWLAKHKDTGRKQAIGVLKGQEAARKAARQRTERWATDILPIVETARDELGGSATLTDLAEWLNKRGHFTATGGRHLGRNFSTTLFNVDRTIAKDAVIECRTQMSALALSADFRAALSDIQPLEAKCLDRIKGGIILSRKLERQRPLSDDELTHAAKQLAIEMADHQREGYVPMLARECYLTEAEFNEAVPDIERMILLREASQTR